MLYLSTDFPNLSTSDIIQLFGIVLALVVGLASIIISVLTLRQSNKMIEESTRPVIAIYGESINPGSPTFYLVVKNLGQTSAFITKFDYDFDFMTMNCYPGSNKIDFLKQLVTASLAPGQSKVCLLEYQNIKTPVTFSIEYKSSSKTYKECITVNLKAGTSMLAAKFGSQEGTELKAIAYTLQEILQKSI